MSKTILLADDSVTIQKVVGLTIANQPYKLVAVGDGQEAVKRAKDAKPDVVIADAVMPNMSGYEVCRALKSDPATASVPVIILAGTFEPYDELKGKEVGVDAVIVKPFESSAFLKAVAKALETPAIQSGASAPASAPAVAPTWAPVAPSQPVRQAAPAPQPVKPASAPAFTAAAPQAAPVPKPAPTPAAPPPQEAPFEISSELDFGDLNDEPVKPAAPVPAPKPEPMEPEIVEPIVEEPSMDIFGDAPTEAVPEVSFDSFSEAVTMPEAEPTPSSLELEDPMSSAESLSMPHGGEAIPMEIESQDEMAAGNYGFDRAEAHSERPQVSIPSAAPLAADQLTVGPKAVQATVEAAASSPSLAGAPPETIEKIAREEIEKIIWDIVPELAEAIIREEINKLLRKQIA